MALDLHVLRNGQPAELLYSIELGQFQRMEPAFNLFEKRTGLHVDQYGDLKLAYGLGPLIQAITDVLASEGDFEARKELESFMAAIESAEMKKLSVVFVGD